jgi:hypothetical protein
VFKTAKPTLSFLLLLTLVLLPAGRIRALSAGTHTTAVKPKPAPTPPPIVTDDDDCCDPDTCAVGGSSPEPPC